MRKKVSFLEHGYIFGILASIIGFMGYIIALLLTPEYVMWKYTISYLGDLSGGIFLRGGLIISNCLAIPFIIYLGRIVKNDQINDIIRKFAVGIGIFTSVSAILTGSTYGALHGIFALFAWIGSAFVCSLFGLLMVKSTKFSKQIVYFGYILGGIIFFYLIPFFTTNFCNLYREICYSFGQKIFLIMPTFEWIVIFGILFWYLSNSIYLIKRRST